MTRRSVVWLTFGLYALCGLLPVLAMLWRSVTPGGRLGLAELTAVLSSQREWILLFNSLRLATITALSVGLLATPLALLIVRTDLPWRKGLAAFFTMPLLLPPLVLAYGWFGLVGRSGPLRGILGSQTELLLGLPGSVLVLVVAFLPVALLATMAALRSVDPKLEEAGRLCASGRAVLWRITLPQVVPAVTSAVLLVFCLALGEFGAPSFLRYNVFAVESLTQFSAFYDASAATAATLPLLALTLLALVAIRAVPGASAVIQPAQQAHPLQCLPLARWRWWAFALVLFLWILLAGAPLGTLVVRAATPSALVEAFQRGGASLARSLGYATVSATLLVVFGFLLGLGRMRGDLGRWTEALALFLFALPGPVLGIGLISLWNRPATAAVYGSPAVLVLGFLAQYAVLPMALTAAVLALVPRSMDEAAAVVGASWARRLISVTLPLCKTGLATAWLVGFLFCIRDAGLSMVLYPPGRDTLPVRIFTLMANGRPELIAALCVLLLLTLLVPLGLLGIVLRRPAIR